jgi:hypothetical protein
MDTTQLITRLAQLPAEIAAAEAKAYDAAQAAAYHKQQLKLKEAQLLTSGQIEGKNAEERGANLLLKTQAEAAVLEEKDDTAGLRRLEWNALQTELSCLRSIARLLTRETE